MKAWWHDLPSEVYAFGWKDKNSDLADKQNGLLQRINILNETGYKVYLLGISAGGSAVLNAFLTKRLMINRAINVCGRLREGNNVYPTLKKAAQSSKIFSESVKNCEKGLNSLTADDRKKILTIRPIYDEIVPVSTVAVKGAKNIRL